MSAAGRLRRTGRSRAVDRFLAVRRPRGSKDSSIYEGLRSLSSPTSDQFRAGASLPAPAHVASRPIPGRLFCDRHDLLARFDITGFSGADAAAFSEAPSPQRRPARPRFHEVKGCAKILVKKESSTGIAGSFFGHRIAFRESWLRLFCISPDQRIAIGCSSRRC